MKKLSNYSYGILIALAILFANCQAKKSPSQEVGNPAETKDIPFPLKVGQRPECIIKAFDDKYYVTVMNGSEPGDAEIVELSTEGLKSFSQGFDEPKGMAFVANHLYVSDLKRVWKVDARGGASVFVDSTHFPFEVSYLNDVCSNADGTGIIIADMGANTKMKDPNGNMWPVDSEEAKAIDRIGRIYHIDLEGQVTVMQEPSDLMINPNGVSIDNTGQLMVGAFFTGNFLVHRNGVLSPLKGQFRGADAVEQDSKGNYYVSSWLQGKVWKIDGATEESVLLIEGLESAADFYLEEEKGRLLLPDMLAGMVYAVAIDQ